MASASSVHYNFDSWADILAFSLIISQAPLVSTSATKSSKTANLYETLTQYCSLRSTLFNFLTVIFVYSLLVSP
jgi:hypothetical protein